MKKHQVNHSMPVPKRRDLRRTSKGSKGAALGIAIIATLALAPSPTPGGRLIDAAPVAFSPLSVEAASFNQPVEVSLLSGVDSIRWDSENITSAAAGDQVSDASDPASVLSSAGSTTQLVGQSVGPLGVLPAGIQLIHPVSSRHITSPYGWRNNPTGAGTQIHIGQDYAIPCGSPVYATADGTVIQSAWAGHSGMRVTVDHGSSVRTGYSHNSSLIAKVGEHVKQGQLIALSGTTGNSTGCHVHFEVIINGRWNDPRNFLPAIPGQPNPMIDSRRTTIAAEPIRNTGEPQANNDNGHDIEVNRPEPSKPAPSPTGPQKETTAPKPTHETKPSRTPKPTQETKPGATPKPTPTRKPSPAPSDSTKPDETPTVTPPTDASSPTPPSTVPSAPGSTTPGSTAPTKPPTEVSDSTFVESPSGTSGQSEGTSTRMPSSEGSASSSLAE